VSKPKANTRAGVRLPIFPNSGIAVFWMKESDRDRAIRSVNEVRQLINSYAPGNVRRAFDSIVFEARD
jgi:hypothetical protein